VGRVRGWGGGKLPSPEAETFLILESIVA